MYYVIGTGRHTETEEPVVIYLDSINRTWVRPLQMFLETIEVEGVSTPRFQPIVPALKADLSTASKANLEQARQRICRMAVNYSFDNLNRWILKNSVPGIPYRMAYSDPTQRISVGINFNPGQGSTTHKTPFTLAYELLQPKKGRKMETWASFSTKIERK